MRRLVSGLCAAILLAAPVVSLAQTSVQSQLDLIANLTKQLKALQDQMQALTQQRAQAVSGLVGTLRTGSTGDQVKILQALLAADTEIYPEGKITGFFGPATTKAVKRFQKSRSLEQVGFVGPKTLKALNEMFEDSPIMISQGPNALGAPVVGTTTTGSMPGFFRHSDDDDEDEDGVRLCAIVPPGHLIAPGWLRKHDGERPIVPTCQNLPPGIIKKLPPPPPTPGPTSTPDVTPPVISAIGSTAGTSTATIAWTTNESADSQVAYGTSTAYGSNTSLDSSLVTSHSQSLSGLLPGTVYHYQVKSKDAAGNTATSSDFSFTTLALDVTPPVISGIGSIVASTTASVVWMTSEPALNKVYYSTVNPLILASTSTLSVAGSAFVTNSTLNLTGLTASTTYYFVAQATDAAGNVSTSSQQSFTTSF